ncbi:hypothetical protein [Alteromonas mediterranea]|uniref:hypothetical protein n=1 Tax=Alteromonas mediterranea TaxID=314275 RepID=UPI0012FC0790|nr:hypothetical protein [Alteromonas mediterranea]QGX61784.1 hypothetical protein FJN15_08485 [Alteromonas mediterranea]
MNKIEDLYGNDLETKYFYIFPVERLDLKNEESLGNIRIFPKGWIDIDDMFSNTIIMLQEDKDKFDSNIEKFKSNPLVVINDQTYADYPGSISSDLQIMTTAISKASIIIDYIKFEFCSLVTPKTMPARLGQVTSGETLLLMYNGKRSPFTRIIDTTIYSNTLTAGVGLDINSEIFTNFKLLNADIGEVGNIAKQALRMFSNALEENDNTGKFIEIMRLFEFVADPNSFTKFQKVRTKIAAHIAENSSDIHRLQEEFKYYSSGDNEDGLRTEIIHNGKSIEVLIPELSKQTDLFNKLQLYITKCIRDLVCFYNKSWVELEVIRDTKLEEAKKNKVKNKTVNYSKTAVLIDVNFLAESIEKFSPIYKELHPEGDFSNLKLEELVYQALLNCRLLEEKKTYKVFAFSNTIDDIPLVKIPISSLDGAKLKGNNCLFELVAFAFEEKVKKIESIFEVTHDIFQDKSSFDSSALTFQNVVFIGDDPEYIDLLKNMNAKDNRNLVVVKCSHYSQMEHRIPFFDVGHLVGMSFGLSASQL